MGIDAQITVTLEKQHWLSSEQVERLSYELAEAVGPGHFLILSPQDHRANPGVPLRALSITEQSGIEQRLSVSLAGRYYGPGYERGDWAVLRSIIYWLTQRIPCGTVWYGGWYSGDEAEAMTVEAISAIDQHWIEHGRRPYNESVRPRGSPCPTCNVPMVKVSIGPGPTLWRCYGCWHEAERST